MSLSMYQASVPRIVNMLTNLDHLLDKALVHIESKKWNEAFFQKIFNLKKFEYLPKQASESESMKDFKAV